MAGILFPVSASPEAWVTMFGATSLSTRSDVAHVKAGQIMLVKAFNFQSQVADPGDQFDYPQKAVLYNILVRPGAFGTKEHSFYKCAWESPNRKAEIIAEEKIMVNGCEWCMSACNNYRYVPGPGVYFFELNDLTAVGNVLMEACIVQDNKHTFGPHMRIGE